MLILHTDMLTLDLPVALVTEAVKVIVIAVGYLLITYLAIMLIHRFVSTVYDSVAIVAIVVLVTIHVIADKLSATFVFVAVAVIIVVEAVMRQPDSAKVTGVIAVIVRVIPIIRILLTSGLLAAHIAQTVAVVVYVINTGELTLTDVAHPVLILVYTDVSHPNTAGITEMIAVLVGVKNSVLLHTVYEMVAFVASAVAVRVATISAYPYII